MTSIPIWFGPRDRLLFGWFHNPDASRARGGVVLCQPLGRDYLRGHYAQRRLAERLCAEGLCVIRFDYDSTGDSVGKSTDPDRFDAWFESTAAAAELLRDSGVGWLAFAGMRSAALMAACAAERDGAADALILIDPTTSGRAFMSEQRALAAMALDVGSREDGSVETPGVIYDAKTVADFKTLKIGGSSTLAKKILVLTRKGTTVDSTFRSRLGDDGVEWGEVTGQEDLVDAEAPYQLLPHDDIANVAKWVSGVAPEQAVSIRPPMKAEAVAVGSGPDGRQVIERPLTLGPNGLFGIVTEIPGRNTGPVIVFLNVATEHHVGPARLWTEMAREWATYGLRSLRVDMSSIGESPTRPGQPDFVIRLPVNFDDVKEIAAAASPDDPSDVVFVGLCSSAYQSLDSALQVHPRGVIALNPVLTFQPPEVLMGGSMDPRRRVALARGSVIEQFSGEGRLSALRKRFPKLGWRIRTLMAFNKRPSLWMKEMIGAGTSLMLICGDRESRPFNQDVSARTFQKMEGTGKLAYEYIPGLDHGLLVAAHRERIRKVVTQHVVEHFANAESSEDRPLQRSDV